ncbi:MAG TPA: DUF4214 domain-containing protein, partial [Pirellulales bacterium]
MIMRRNGRLTSRSPKLRVARKEALESRVLLTSDTATSDLLITSGKVGSAGNQPFVNQAYQDLLGRPADAGGLAYWAARLNSGTSQVAIAQALTHSDEYDSIVISAAYQNDLARLPDAGGLAYWTAKLHAGLSDEQLEADLLGSEEFCANAGDGDELWLNAIYVSVLGRPADNGGDSYWTNQLKAGAGLSTVAYAFATSPEQESERIQADYQRFVGRTAGASELSFWINQLAHGVSDEDLIAELIGSLEYLHRAAGGGGSGGGGASGSAAIPAVLLVDPADKGSLDVSGNAEIAVNGGSIVVDSISPLAAVANGRGRVDAAELDVHGTPGLFTTGLASVTATVHSGASVVADPLSGLPTPAIPSRTLAAVKAAGNDSLTLSPGTYVGGISASGNSAITLLPGLYYLKGGGLSVSGQASIVGDGVTIFNDNAGSIHLSGNGSLRLAPPTDGTYHDIVLFQDRANTKRITVSGAASATITGTVYAPAAKLDLAGNAVLIAPAAAGFINEDILDGLNDSGNAKLQIDATFNNPISLATSLVPASKTLANGGLVTNQPASTITGTTSPGAAVALETGADALFDEGQTIAGSSGDFSLPAALAEGPNTLQVRASLRFDQQTIVSTAVLLDTMPPTIAITSPASGVLTNHNETIVGKVSDAADGVASLSESVDGSAYSPVTFDSSGNFSFTTALALDGTADGAHTVHFEATDNAGNTSSVANLAFTLDTVPPTIAITSPASGVLTNHNETIVGKVSDATDGVASLSESVDGGAYSPVTFDSSGNFSFTTALARDGTADGAHTVHFEAT